MKTIGLIGGMSWQSTLEYYRIINKLVSERLGKLHSAKCLIYSFDFEEIAEGQRTGDWEGLGRLLAEAAMNLENCGAEVVLICTNTMHKVADLVSDSINVPLINIIDVTAEEVISKGLKTVGLLGTKFTMEDGFYTERLNKHGVNVLTPDAEERDFVHSTIFNELCKGVVNVKSKKKFLKIVSGMVEKGVEGIILGCTEIPLLINEEDVNVEVFDTTFIHSKKAVDFSLTW